MRDDYTYAQLSQMPTLAVGQADDLKVDTGTVRVWISRVGKADGAASDHEISVEVLKDGRWTAGNRRHLVEALAGTVDDQDDQDGRDDYMYPTPPITSAEAWADALDRDRKHGPHISPGDQVSWAYADGSICDVAVDPNAPEADTESAVLVSLEHGWVVYWEETSSYWYARR
jgi:hypothetical protein